MPAPPAVARTRSPNTTAATSVRVDDHQTDAAAKAKIDTLRARIAGGADFETVAKESSEDNNSKGQGGDLGWFPVDAFGPAFGQQVAGIRTAASASRSAPMPVGTSCSAWPPARPT